MHQSRRALCYFARPLVGLSFKLGDTWWTKFFGYSLMIFYRLDFVAHLLIRMVFPLRQNSSTNTSWRPTRCTPPCRWAFRPTTFSNTWPGLKIFAAFHSLLNSKSRSILKYVWECSTGIPHQPNFKLTELYHSSPMLWTMGPQPRSKTIPDLLKSVYRLIIRLIFQAF